MDTRRITPQHQEWPTEMLDPSTGVEELWVRGGRLDLVLVDPVAVVGSRASTQYGDGVAAQIGGDLAASGRTVVAGASFGVEAAAHCGALAQGGPTVAVLACGVDVAHPAAHLGLLDEIMRRGAVVSPYPPGTTPTRTRSLARARLIAALADGTVVVEAAIRSGSLVTAEAAKALGRPLFAVPGPVTSTTSKGCHALLRSGMATIATDAEDVVAGMTGQARSTV